MKYRAIAARDERSNAVGTVELECTAQGLSLVYLGVGAWSEGYAPAALASGTSLLVPWSSVDEAYVEGERLFLSFDPKLSPHCRLLLGTFSTGARVHHRELYRRRVVVRSAGIAAAVVAALIALSAVARLAPARGPALAITVAALSALGILGLAFFADRVLVYGGVEAEAARDAFAFELRGYLPAVAQLPAAPARAKPARTLADFQGLIPRTTFAIVLTLTASGLGAVLMARYLLSTQPQELDEARPRRTSEQPSSARDEASEPARPAPVNAARPASPAKASSSAASTSAPESGATLGQPCRCERGDSSLWAEPLPKLSILVISHKVRQGRGEEESRRKKYTELDIAVINNSRHEIDEVSLVVMFYEREQGKDRELVSNRPLFYEGPLLPAQAIKWSVEAEGSEYELQNPIIGTVGENGEDAAPADRAAELLKANHRPVRLHGALLLSFLGDPRAKEAVLQLREALREDEASYLTRLADAQRELRVCRLRPHSSGKINGCVFNAASEPKSDVGVKVRALAEVPNHEKPTAEPPALLGETVLSVPGQIAPATGVTFSGPFAPAAQNAAAYEAAADRIDLLK